MTTNHSMSKPAGVAGYVTFDASDHLPSRTVDAERCVDEVAGRCETHDGAAWPMTRPQCVVADSLGLDPFGRVR